VSGDFFRHAVSYFIEPVLAAHDRVQFRILCFYSGTVQDEVTARLRSLCTAWRDVAALSDEALAASIREEGVDVLVDLSGHSKGERLLALARRPAPVQITWLGYLNTTGMAAMDYRLTDVVADPPGEPDRLHRERLLRLPECQWCYRPPADAPAVSPLTAHGTGRVTFASFNHFDKLSERCVGLWAKVLSNVPTARLAVFGVPAAESADFLLDVFEREGLDIGRIDLRRPLDFDAYLRARHEVDIALDSLPYNGATTTCESLWMGVPVVSRAGVAGAQRSGASLLGAVGLAELVAQSDDDYVEKARRLAADVTALAALRQGLRERVARSSLLDAERFVRQLESAYRQAWRDWCARDASRSA
jgi:predicted O-linked N-acetylglucosamine transferase (SPINDLY family)